MKKILFVLLLVLGIVNATAYSARAQSVNYLDKFFADVYSAFFGNPSSPRAVASDLGQGTLTFHGQFGKESDTGRFFYQRDLTADEARQVKVDVYYYQSIYSGPTYVARGISLDSPATIPVLPWQGTVSGPKTQYGIYSFTVSAAPSGYKLAGAFCQNDTFPSAGGNLAVSPGGSNTCDIGFYTETFVPGALSGQAAQGGPSGTVVQPNSSLASAQFQNTISRQRQSARGWGSNIFSRRQKLSFGNSVAMEIGLTGSAQRRHLDN